MYQSLLLFSFESNTIESAFTKLLVLCFSFIFAIIGGFYTLERIKKALIYGCSKPKKTKPNVYASFLRNQSILGWCISWNVKNLKGELGERRSYEKQKIKITVPEIKQKISYLMQTEKLKRKDIIILVNYLQEFAPKKNKKFENDLHYIHHTLKHEKLNEGVLKCIWELLNEFSLENSIDNKQQDKVINFKDYKQIRA